jgi:hypothetical protein
MAALIAWKPRVNRVIRSANNLTSTSHTGIRKLGTDAVVISISGYMVAAGLVASAISSTAVDDGNSSAK